MTTPPVEIPAILNGRPVRPEGPPGWPRADESVRSVLRQLSLNGDWGRYHGPHCPELCRRLAEYHSIEHVLLCSSGTAAIEMALRGVGVGPSHEVIMAGYDFKSNFQNILCLGAVPVLVDLDPTTWQVDANRIAASVTSKTRAILVAHLHGGLVDLQQVRKVADLHGIAVVEDACQNPGAILCGRRAGTWGDVGVLSFGGSKLVTAGRGGAVLTHKAEFAERIKRFVYRGNDAYPISEMQAAVILPQFEQLDALNDRRNSAVRMLQSRLANLPGLTMLNGPDEVENREPPLAVRVGDLPMDDNRNSSVHDHRQVPQEQQRRTPEEPGLQASIPDSCGSWGGSPGKPTVPAYYKVAFRYRAEDFGGLSRDGFVQSVRAEGVAFDAGFRGLHLIHASRRFRAADELPQTTLADAQMVTLYHPVLLDDDLAIEEIATAIHKVCNHAGEISHFLTQQK